MESINNQAADETTASIVESFSVLRPRRALLKGAVAGLAGGAALGAASLFNQKKQAKAWAGEGAEATVQQILNIAVTAERLAVTTYSNGLANARKLGLKGDNLVYLKAALVEEQIHELFFESAGGKPLTSTFSYPHGQKTFTDLTTFIETQQQLEGVFDSAFLAAVKEFALMGQARLAQIVGQIATIEAEHRVLGRVILNLSPADNWAFTPVFLESVSDAPQAVAQAGYLSPKPGNSYTYHQVSTNFNGIEYRTPFTVGEDND